MPRPKSVKTRSNKIRKTKLTQNGIISKTQIPQDKSHGLFTVTSRRSVNYTLLFSQFLNTILPSSEIKDNNEITNDNLFLDTNKAYLSASVLFRIINWKQATHSILNRTLNCRLYGPSMNHFESIILQHLEEFCEETLQYFCPSSHLVFDSEFKSTDYPFVAGTPDFVFFDETGKALIVIECKDIVSKQQFDKLIYANVPCRPIFRQQNEYTHQLNTYLNILNAPIGIMLIRHNHIIYYLLLKPRRFDCQSIEKLRNFYFHLYLPKLILGTKPKLRKGKLEYFNHQQKELIDSIVKARPLWKKVFLSDTPSKFSDQKEDYL